MLTRLGLNDAGARVGTLSGGQKKRVALVAALLRPADVLVLDEPTNHLDADMVLWLEDWLKHFGGAVVMVTHDRYFLERVVNRIAELTDGTLYFYEANYSRYLALKLQRTAYAEAAERKRQQLLKKEYEWIQRGCEARRTKSRDRIERYEALRQEKPERQAQSVCMSSLSARLGKSVLSLTDVSKAFGDKTVLRQFSYSVGRSDRIGIIGHNGAGKTTLLRLLDGSLLPDAGEITVGATVRIGHFTQMNQTLPQEERIYDYIAKLGTQVETDDGTFTAAQMLERFLFPRTLQYTQIGRLSGGEQRRLYLLSVLMRAPNVLLLDEPTNDLDITTLSVLEDYLDGFSGPVLAVSHDRYFLDRIAEQIFALSEDGSITRYPGNYSDYLAARPESAPAADKKSAAEKQLPPRNRRLKFSYNEQREYAGIEAEIAALEAASAACDEKIAACGADYQALEAAMQEKETAQTLLSQKTERWLYLSELAEKIEAQEEAT
jgi:ATP-binding cassette subfamily F protein uup